MSCSDSEEQSHLSLFWAGVPNHVPGRAESMQVIILTQWFPNGVPRHTGVPWEESRCAVGFWDSGCLIT